MGITTLSLITIAECFKMNMFFKKAAEMADGVFDLVSMLSSRMEGKRELAKTSDLFGCEPVILLRRLRE
ncbi:MAG: hypothetical protein K2Z81_26035 [Cyanobacteria bacterium]|nr:hypothetical protein [Cyanobacteriota bacterium]